jgi:hypothetical protein
MSERITWQPCPCCGSRAAVGWAPVTGADRGPTDDVPVEFDCSRGCQLEEADLRRWVRVEAEKRRPNG